jgi:integrase
MTKKLTTPKERERCLDDRELVEVWRASDFLDQDPQGEFRKRRNQYNPTGPTWSPIIKLLILLGARRAEISELRWSEVKLREGLLQLPGSRTKRLPGHTNEERIIYLSRQAREILQAMPRRIGCDFVFPNSDGSAAVKGGWGRATLRLKKLVERARVEKGIKEAMPDFWVHDFRRVLVTGLQRLGIPIEVTETILGHISGSRAGIVKVYHKYGFKKEARAAVQKWADRVECFLAGKFDKDEDVEQEKIS